MIDISLPCKRCSCADTTALLKEFSLPSRLQNFRTVSVPSSFAGKTAQISRQFDQILSGGTWNCIFVLFTYVPKNSADQEGITCALSRCMPKPRLCRVPTNT